MGCERRACLRKRRQKDKDLLFLCTPHAHHPCEHLFTPTIAVHDSQRRCVFVASMGQAWFESDTLCRHVGLWVGVHVRERGKMWGYAPAWFASRLSLDRVVGSVVQLESATIKRSNSHPNGSPSKIPGTGHVKKARQIGLGFSVRPAPSVRFRCCR